jgi:hypothetical protein
MILVSVASGFLLLCHHAQGQGSNCPLQVCRLAYFEKLNDPFFNKAIAKCKEFGLYDIMGFRYNWNEEILA